MSRGDAVTCLLKRCDAGVLTQAVPIAAAGAIYPIAFAAIVAILGGAEPMRRAIAFLAGGALTSLIAFLVIVFVLSALHITPRHHPTASAAIKIALGAALLGLAAYALLRHGIPRTATLPDKTPTETPGEPPDDAGGIRRAFISGIVVYFPGLFLIASAKAVTDAHASIVPTAATSVLCVLVLLLIVEVPIVAFAVARERVRPPLERITGAAKMHSKQVILAVELVGGIYLLVSGILAL